jgi:hypothetical protein
MKRIQVTLVLACACACATEPKARNDAPNAQFGVFFGGQIQERREIPFELDRGKQTLGFRIDFPAPLPRDVPVEWQISAPVTGKRKKVAPGASTEAPVVPPPKLSASDVARTGESRFERTTPLEAGDPTGLWNIRVVAGGRVVIDRPYEVYDPIARARASKPDAAF